MLLLNVTTVTKIVNGGALTIQSLSLFISLLSSLHLVEYYPESLLVLENLIMNNLISSNHCHLGHVPLVTCGDVHESVPHFRSKCLFIQSCLFTSCLNPALNNLGSLWELGLSGWGASSQVTCISNGVEQSTEMALNLKFYNLFFSCTMYCQEEGTAYSTLLLYWKSIINKSVNQSCQSTRFPGKLDLAKIYDVLRRYTPMRNSLRHAPHWFPILMSVPLVIT